MARRNAVDRCPGCDRPLTQNVQGITQFEHAETCPFSDRNLLGLPGPALGWNPASYDSTADDAAPGSGTEGPRRIVPLLGMRAGRNTAAEDVDALLDYEAQVAKRRRIVFEIQTDAEKAVLWERVGVPDHRGLAPMRPVMSVPLAEKAKLYAEAGRRCPGIDVGRGIVERRGETRGRPATVSFDIEWERDRAAYFARVHTLLREGRASEEVETEKQQMLGVIATKYSRKRRCPICGERVPNTWRRKECSVRCRQQAYLRRKSGESPTD